MTTTVTKHVFENENISRKAENFPVISHIIIPFLVATGLLFFHFPLAFVIASLLSLLPSLHFVTDHPKPSHISSSSVILVFFGCLRSSSPVRRDGCFWHPQDLWRKIGLNWLVNLLQSFGYTPLKDPFCILISWFSWIWTRSADCVNKNNSID